MTLWHLGWILESQLFYSKWKKLSELRIIHTNSQVLLKIINIFTCNERRTILLIPIPAFSVLVICLFYGMTIIILIVWRGWIRNEEYFRKILVIERRGWIRNKEYFRKILVIKSQRKERLLQKKSHQVYVKWVSYISPSPCLLLILNFPIINVLYSAWIFLSHNLLNYYI